MKLKLSNALFLLLMFCASLAQADSTYKPYVLASVAPADVKAKLEAEGFEVVGEYKPYDGAEVIVVTSEALKTAASGSIRGGYGAVMRVAISTKDDGESQQVSYTNPAYWANGYRMATELSDVAAALEKALGNDGEFGSKKGLTREKLRKYHYMVGMPYFDKPTELVTYPSHKKAVEEVEANLKAGKGETTLVYRVDIPGKNETVFGMGLKGDHDGADKKAMATLSGITGDPKHTAYMPYEILVYEGKVEGKKEEVGKAEILHGKFRIALSFPDLSMWNFMKIRNAPDGIEEAAKAVAK